MRPVLSHKVIIASILVVLWAAATAYAFWWFEFKNLRTFDSRDNGQLVEISASSLQSLLLRLTQHDTHNVRVIHFWNPDCYCNRFNLQHLQQIRLEYAKQGVGFYLALSGNRYDYQTQIDKQFGDIPVLELGESGVLIPSTPSAAIIKTGYGLTYFGPYSTGAMCSAQSGSFVEKILDETLSGTPAVQINTLAFGCYCDLNPV